MLKLLVVDDEKIIRNGILKAFDWSTIGIETVGEAENGRDALTKCNELKPDIVIADIRMPVMDGLEFVKILKEKMPKTHAILLSGYDDFTYAKQAIQLHISEYLLKPVGVEELRNVTAKLADEIHRERAMENENLTNKIILSENYQIIKSSFLNSLIKKEAVSPDIIADKTSSLKIELNGPGFFVFILDIDHYYSITENMSDSQKASLLSSVLTAGEESLQKFMTGYLFYGDSSYLAGIVNMPDGMSGIPYDAFTGMSAHIKSIFNLSVTIGIGGVCRSINDLNKSYDEAVDAVQQKVHKGIGGIYCFTGKQNVTA